MKSQVTWERLLDYPSLPFYQFIFLHASNFYHMENVGDVAAAPGPLAAVLAAALGPEIVLT